MVEELVYPAILWLKGKKLYKFSASSDNNAEIEWDYQNNPFLSFSYVEDKVDYLYAFFDEDTFNKFVIEILEKTGSFKSEDITEEVINSTYIDDVFYKAVHTEEWGVDAIGIYQLINANTDKILDKISKKGIESITEIEKAVLQEDCFYKIIKDNKFLKRFKS